MFFVTQSPDIIPFTISIILYVIVLGLDIITPWPRGLLASVLGYLNIALHIAFFLSLFFVGVYIEVPVLAFMVSLFAYSLSSCLAYKKAKNPASKKQDEEEGEA